MMRRRLSAVGLAAAGSFVLVMEAFAMDARSFEDRLLQIMSHCGRPGYVLRPTSGKRLIIRARPEIRQTPLSAADMKCIEGEVRKIGWKLHEEHKA
jgi:hypothetical protein